MTVKELKQKLSNFDENLEVCMLVDELLELSVCGAVEQKEAVKTQLKSGNRVLSEYWTLPEFTLETTGVSKQVVLIG